MLELPPKFKSALGNGIRTSLFPVVRFYKDVRLDEPDTWNEAEPVNLSIKDTNLDGIAFDPLLINAPSVKSSADIINNKYTISSVSLSISNAPYNGKIFSDGIQSLLNAVCQVYYCANGLDSLDDCLLVYTGTVRRFNQSAESIKLELEDITEQMLTTKIPSSLVSDEGFYKEKDKGKPYPMVYGYVDRSPLIVESEGADGMGELNLSVARLNIDKKGKKIAGIWETPNIENYGNEFFNEQHRLIQEEFLNIGGGLSIYSNNFIPLPRDTWVEGWGIKIDEDTYIQKANERILYDFINSTDQQTSASIDINSNGLIDDSEEDIYGIPTRIYRNIKEIKCFTFCDSNQEGDQLPSINRIYGFTGFELNENPVIWEPWDFSSNVTLTLEENPCAQNRQEGDGTWWEPTACNDNINGGVWGTIDTNWGGNIDNQKFPTERLENGLTTDGIYLCGRNLDGLRGEHNKSGGAYIRMVLNEVGSFTCQSKILFDAQYHSFAGMRATGDTKMPYPAMYWAENTLPVSTGLPNAQAPDGTRTATGLVEQGLFGDPDNIIAFPNVPSGNYTQWGWEINDWQTINYANQNDHTDDFDTEDTVRQIGGFYEASTFNNTSTFNAINFGIPQYPKRGFFHGDDRGYVAVQLFNTYLLQDSIIDNPVQQDYYGDIAGRFKEFEPLTGNIISITVNFNDIDGFYWDVECESPHLLSVGDKIKISETEYYNGYQIVGDIVSAHTFRFYFTDTGEGGIFNEEGGVWEREGFEILVSPDKIMEDILRSELNYQGNISLSSTYLDWQNSFTLNEQKEAKQVFEELFKSSLIIPSFDANGQFKFINLKQIIDTTAGLPVINNEDVVKYSFELSKIDDIYNQVNVKYRKNYASGDFDKETGYSLIGADDKEYETYDAVTESLYPETPSNHYSVDYYGLKSEETKLDIQSEYIRDELTARKLQKRLVSWYANQHLITKIDLPVSYMDLEAGDYIKFDELLGGKLAFGQDYTIHTNKNGQVIYPVFFITKVSKTLQKISIEAIQIHRGEYGFPEIIQEQEDYVDGGGNNGQGNHNFPDPNDNPDYNQDTITEEETEEEQQPDPYFNASWLNNLNDITNNPRTAIVSTNILEDWDYDIFISQVYTSTGEGITYENDSGEQVTINDGIYSEENSPSAMDLVYHTKSISDMVDNYNGQVLISKKFVFEMDEYPEEVQVTFIIKIYNDNNTQYLDFNQNGEYVDVDILGDVNGDFVLNILDAVMMSGAIINNTEDELENADMNDDGIVNVQDLVALVNQILGQ